MFAGGVLLPPSPSPHPACIVALRCLAFALLLLCLFDRTLLLVNWCSFSPFDCSKNTVVCCFDGAMLMRTCASGCWILAW